MSLPLEVIELIVDASALEDAKSVKALSLVCPALLPHCRKYLFKTISIPRWVHRKRRATSFWELIRETPELGPHVRTIAYYAFDIEPLTDAWNPELSKQLIQLRSLRVCPRHLEISPEDPEWNKIPHRHILLSLLYLPTLTHFELRWFQNFFLSDLIPCVNLTHLELNSVILGKEVPGDLVMALPKPMMINQLAVRRLWRYDPAHLVALSNAQRTDGKPIVDLTNIQTLHISFYASEICYDAVLATQKWRQLVKVEVYLGKPSPSWDRLYDALRGSLETLRCLKLNTIIDKSPYMEDPIPRMSQELGKFRCSSVVERIEIIIMSRLLSVSDRGDKWRTLNHTLSEAGWSRLNYVSVGVEMKCMVVGQLDEVLSWRETHFSSLVSSSTIHFELKVTLPNQI